jgi:hypothetical protein
LLFSSPPPSFVAAVGSFTSDIFVKLNKSW